MLAFAEKCEQRLHLHYLADGREEVRETQRARELRRSRRTPGNIISSMPHAELIRVPRRAPQTAIILLCNRNAFDTPAPIASLRLAGAQRFWVFFFFMSNRLLLLLLQEPNAKLLERRPAGSSGSDKTSVHLWPVHASSS